MRELKFNVWDKIKKRMLRNAFELKSYGWDKWVQMENASNDLIWLQNTGLKDKNGKDIYEGDILSDYTQTDEGIKKSHCQVFWNNGTGGWHLDLSFNQDRSHSFSLTHELNDFEYEVSGNIYESPELINSSTIERLNQKP